MAIRNNYRGHNYLRIGEKITQRVIKNESFYTISVAGQSDIVASPSTALTIAVVISGLTPTTNASTDTLTFTVNAGTETAQGSLELATNAEAVSGTDTARAITAANLTARLAAPGAIGQTTAATIIDIDNIQINGNTVASTSGDLQLKAVSGSNITLQDDADSSKEVTLNISSVSSSAERTWTFADSSDTFVGKATTDTLTNKTLTSPTINSPTIGGTWNSYITSTGKALVMGF